MKQTDFHALGFDIGGTKIAAGLVSFPEGELRAFARKPTGPERGSDAVRGDILSLGRQLLDQAETNHSLLRGIGVGICELVDGKGEIISANCLRLSRSDFEPLAGIAPVVVEADVRAAALAEALFGAGRSFRQFLYITVGTGISCCLMIEGKPFTGSRGLTGTMASSPLPRPWPESGDSSKIAPTLEEIAAGPGLVRRCRQMGHLQATSAEEVCAAAAGGDAAAKTVVESAGETLGAAAGWLINVLDPQALVVGGGLGLSGGLYWESFIDSTRRHIWSPLHRELPILKAALGAKSGVIGAAAAVWKQTCGAPRVKNELRTSR